MISRRKEREPATERERERRDLQEKLIDLHAYSECDPGSIQVAELNEFLKDADGQPKMLTGWSHMVEYRKAAMFRAIVGAARCRGAESASLLKAKAKVDLSPGFAAQPPAAAGPSCTEGLPSGFAAQLPAAAGPSTEEMPSGSAAQLPAAAGPSTEELPSGFAAQPSAAAGPSTGESPLDWQTWADGDEMNHGQQDDGHLEFGGKLDMADDIALTFRLASEGKLEMVDDMARTFRLASEGKPDMAGNNALTSQLDSEWKVGAIRTRDDLLYYAGKRASFRALAKLCEEAEMDISTRQSPRTPSEEGGRAPNSHSPGTLCEEGARAPSGHPPGTVCEEGGRAPESCSRTRSWWGGRAAGRGSLVLDPTEEKLLLGWSPHWDWWREGRYAVTALDPAQAEQLLRHLQEKAHLHNGQGRPRDITIIRDVRRIVAAAVRRGQGLLLTVQEATEREYRKRREEKEVLYYDVYREHLNPGWSD
jgi:hypothetical protein